MTKIDPPKPPDRSPPGKTWPEATTDPHWPTPDPVLAHDDSDLDADTMSETDLRAQLKAARHRVKALETVKIGGPGRLTHGHDIERYWRLGKLSADEIAAYQETGQLPRPAGNGPEQASK